MTKGPIRRIISKIRPNVLKKKKTRKAKPLKDRENILERVNSPMLRNYIKSLAKKLDRPIEEVIHYQSVKDYAEKLGLELDL